MEVLLEDVLEEFEVASEEELLNNYGYNDFKKKVEEGLFSYDELICLGLLDEETVVAEIGYTEAIAEGVLTEAEAEQWKKEDQLLKGIELES